MLACSQIFACAKASFPKACRNNQSFVLTCLKASSERVGAVSNVSSPEAVEVKIGGCCDVEGFRRFRRWPGDSKEPAVDLPAMPGGSCT